MSYDWRFGSSRVSCYSSQSLWNRAVSYDKNEIEKVTAKKLSQSLWNRAVSYDTTSDIRSIRLSLSQSLWNRAVSYDGYIEMIAIHDCMSQSLWNRAVSYDSGSGAICLRSSISLNPFGTGRCLTTAVGSSSLVRQGLPKPLPNFFRDSESWVLIWLNVEQVLTFHLHIKRSKT